MKDTWPVRPVQLTSHSSSSKLYSTLLTKSHTLLCPKENTSTTASLLPPPPPPPPSHLFFSQSQCHNQSTHFNPHHHLLFSTHTQPWVLALPSHRNPTPTLPETLQMSKPPLPISQNHNHRRRRFKTTPSSPTPTPPEPRNLPSFPSSARAQARPTTSKSPRPIQSPTAPPPRPYVSSSGRFRRRLRRNT